MSDAGEITMVTAQVFNRANGCCTFEEIAEDFTQMFRGWGMRNRFRRAIGRLPRVEQTKAACVVEFCFGMATIDVQFAILHRDFEVLLNATVVLGAEAEIVCAVYLAVLGRASIEVSGKGEMFSAVQLLADSLCLTPDSAQD
jgi:hypothetical protein